MSRTASPLRYPGGKSALLDLVSSILLKNRLDGGHYAEPFAGGGGLALSLLFEGMVGEIHLNDIDPGISALWRCLLKQTDDLIDKMNGTPITIEEWQRQKLVNSAPDGDDLDLGFSTLFLNRTNRSGIIKGAGVIGGLRQNGNYLLDCRFNKEDLSRRIRRIARYKDRIHFTSDDALVFLKGIEAKLPARGLLCADPPYFDKGSNLYTSFYRDDDHADLADSILDLECPWITTYDNCPEISRLYNKRRQFEFSVQYSVQTKRVASELMIVSKGLRMPRSLLERRFKPTSHRTV